MTDRTPEDFARRSAQALARYAAADAALAAEGDRPARAGDLFALPATAHWPVEWAVIGPAPDAPQRLLAVPADHHPLAGSGDVAIPEEAPAGPLTVRCRFPVRIAAGDLAPRLRSGLLEPAATAEVARTRSDLEAGRLVPSDEQEEVDSNPEYRRWIAETIVPACAAIGAARGPWGSGRGVGEPAPPPRRARRERRSAEWRRALPLAASVLLAISLALSGGVLVQSQRVERLEAESAAGEGRLRAEIEELSEAGRRRAEAHRREAERLARERDDALAAAERPPAPPPASGAEPLVNLPFAWLRPEGDATRGEPPAVEVSPTAGLVALILPIDDPGPHRRFGLEIVREATAERIWTTDELVLTGLAETSLALPAGLLPAGDYTLRLSGLGAGGRVLLATYRLRVGSGGPDR